MYARAKRTPNARIRSIRHRGMTDWIPPIQLAPTGSPISIMDQTVGAIVMSLVFVVLAKVLGPAFFL